MKYYGRIFRPPSEARSLIIQVTIACSHNKCTFCCMYKGEQFRVREFDEIAADLKEMRMVYRNVDKIFLADGDALCLKTDKLIAVLDEIYRIFPECKRVGIYGSARDANAKTHEELSALKEHGLGIVYLGAESGNPQVLLNVKKADTREAMISGIRKIEDAGIPTSVTFISGLGGKALWREHAVDTGTLISEARPSYASLLSLILEGTEPICKEISSGKFIMLSSVELLDETELLIRNINLDQKCIFRSNHASNYLVLKGNLPDDKEMFLRQIAYAKANPGTLRPEYFRGI